MTSKQGGRGDGGKSSWEKDEGQERRLKKLKGEATGKRKVWEEGLCLGCREKGHVIAQGPKVLFDTKGHVHVLNT